MSHDASICHDWARACSLSLLFVRVCALSLALALSRLLSLTLAPSLTLSHTGGSPFLLAPWARLLESPPLRCFSRIQVSILSAVHHVDYDHAFVRVWSCVCARTHAHTHTTYIRISQKNNKDTTCDASPSTSARHTPSGVWLDKVDLTWSNLSDGTIEGRAGGGVLFAPLPRPPSSFLPPLPPPSPRGFAVEMS